MLGVNLFLESLVLLVGGEWVGGDRSESRELVRRLLSSLREGFEVVYIRRVVEMKERD